MLSQVLSSCRLVGLEGGLPCVVKISLEGFKRDAGGKIGSEEEVENGREN